MPDWQERLARIAQRNRQEIVHAKLSRREMMRLGLLTPAGMLVAKAGLSSRAFGAAAPPPSPTHRPWAQPMPILPALQPKSPGSLRYGPPDGTTPIDGATRRINHQLCSYEQVDGEDRYGGPFPPRKFYEMFMQEAEGRFHPDWGPTKFWGFGDAEGKGRYPGPRINATYGEPIMVRFHNLLPSKSKYVGFGIPEITTHLHNGHTPSESDGNPVNYINSINDPNPINPKGFKDQHYPNVYAGYTRYPNGPDGNSPLPGDPREAMSSLWYHDHHIDFTAQNVVKGMVGPYTLFDAQDTGGETSGLRLPSGEFDVPIMFGDFVFDQNYQMVFDLFNTDGILGDKFCANGAIQPYFNVKPRRYRLRLYNHGPSRWYDFALYDGTNFLPFWQISNDGNLLPEALQRTSVKLAVAERVDIVVDFSKIKSSRIYIVNRAEQFNGRGPTGRQLTPGTPIVQINKVGSSVPDNSVDPGDSAMIRSYGLSTGPTGKLKMRDLPDADFGALLARAEKAKKRTWRFERANGAWVVNNRLFDPNVTNASIDQESEEVWIIQNPSGDWSHPVHIHFEEHRTLSRNGVLTPPSSSEYGRKDVIELGPNEEVRIFMRFRDMKGRYVMHCHNVIHEDAAMMVRWDIV